MKDFAEFLEAVHSREPVAGLTHDFYRYPARFSPLFAGAAIKTFSQPGDVVLDPFMGGGTTLVESRILGRRGVGTDINGLAVFISRVKTTLFSQVDLSRIRVWAKEAVVGSSSCQLSSGSDSWAELGYLKNISDNETRSIRKSLQLLLNRVNELSEKQQNLARCIILKTAQWALDCRTEVPSARLFREEFARNAEEMTVGARKFAELARQADKLYQERGSTKTLCLERSVVGLEKERHLKDIPTPTLILTSPPYPGVHVLYHRWQIHGRRETAAPFWITDHPDGNGASYYTFGDRKQVGLANYYKQALAAFTSLAQLSDKKTRVIQLVAFSDPAWQLPQYLGTMEQAGFKEMRMPDLSNSPDGRLWRCVPNRKWYASQRGEIPTSKEVVLFHRLA